MHCCSSLYGTLIPTRCRVVETSPLPNRWHPFWAGSEIRLKGKNLTETEHIKLGAYHTLTLEISRPFELHKATWDVLDVERLKEACDAAASADLAAVLITVRGPGLGSCLSARICSAAVLVTTGAGLLMWRLMYVGLRAGLWIARTMHAMRRLNPSGAGICRAVVVVGDDTTAWLIETFLHCVLAPYALQRQHKIASCPVITFGLAPLQEGLATVCLVGSSCTLLRASIETSIPKKRGAAAAGYDKALERFFDKVYQVRGAEGAIGWQGLMGPQNMSVSTQFQRAEGGTDI